MSNEELLLKIGDLLEVKLEEKLEEKLNAKFDEKLAPVNRRLDSLEVCMGSLETRMGGLETRMDGLEVRMDRLEDGQKKLELRQEKLESEVSALKQGQIDVRRKLETLTQKVDRTYDMALDAWGKSTENRKWLETAGV